jgi:hypothetical protein
LAGTGVGPSGGAALRHKSELALGERGHVLSVGAPGHVLPVVRRRNLRHPRCPELLEHARVAGPAPHARRASRRGAKTQRGTPRAITPRVSRTPWGVSNSPWLARRETFTFLSLELTGSSRSRRRSSRRAWLQAKGLGEGRWLSRRLGDAKEEGCHTHKNSR